MTTGSDRLLASARFDVRVVHSADEAQTKPGVLGDDEYCDALVSNTPKVLLAIKTADCVPVLIGCNVTRSFAAVHAGWRGTSSSIVKLAIENYSATSERAPRYARRNRSGRKCLLL